MSQLKVTSADLGYPDQRILKDVNLAIEPGEFLAILGPNGSGKTTLFRSLLGLIKPLSGMVERSPGAIGFVPQVMHLDSAWPLSVAEILEMGAARRMNAASRSKALAKLELVGMQDHARSVFTKLSGGQRQRVLLARALLGDPAMLFFDEPTSGVDRPNQELTMQLLHDLNQAPGGPTILLVSHELDLLAPIASGALWVDRGRVKRLDQAALQNHTGIAGLFQSQTC